VKPLRPGLGVRQAYERVRQQVMPLARDRSLSPDIERLERAVRAGAFIGLAREDA